MIPKRDPLYFRIALWIAWRPGWAAALIAGWSLCMFALGRFTRDG